MREPFAAHGASEISHVYPLLEAFGMEQVSSGTARRRQILIAHLELFHADSTVLLHLVLGWLAHMCRSSSIGHSH